MELHEWLQQLKDKTMSHLEVLMQKGDIQGPPYVMPDDIELTFLRKFIERHNANIPHNPRLRHLGPGAQPPHIEESMEVSTPELSDPGYPPGLVDQMARLQPGMQSFILPIDLVNKLFFSKTIPSREHLQCVKFCLSFTGDIASSPSHQTVVIACDGNL